MVSLVLFVVVWLTASQVSQLTIIVRCHCNKTTLPYEEVVVFHIKLFSVIFINHLFSFLLIVFGSNFKLLALGRFVSSLRFPFGFYFSSILVRRRIRWLFSYKFCEGWWWRWLKFKRYSAVRIRFYFFMTGDYGLNYTVLLWLRPFWRRLQP